MIVLGPIKRQRQCQHIKSLIEREPTLINATHARHQKIEIQKKWHHSVMYVEQHRALLETALLKQLYLTAFLVTKFQVYTEINFKY